MPTAPRQNVAPPRFTPRRFGLLSAAELVDDADPHWRNGVEFQADLCVDAKVILDPACAPATGFSVTEGLVVRAGDTMAVFAGIACSPVGINDERARALAAAALTNNEARAIEKEFFTGEAGYMPHLAEDVEVLTASGAVLQSAATQQAASGVSAIEGIGRLEEGLGECYGGQGVLHLPLAIAAGAIAAGLVVTRGERMETVLGTAVAAGAGYPGTTPAGAAPATGLRWAYATGAVMVRRSPIEYLAGPPLGELLNRSTNDVLLIAWRTVQVSWDCCHLAVPINIGA